MPKLPISKTVNQKNSFPTNKAMAGAIGAPVGVLIASIFARKGIIVGQGEIIAVQAICAMLGSLGLSWLAKERR
jgi:hypothetical protein